MLAIRNIRANKKFQLYGKKFKNFGPWILKHAHQATSIKLNNTYRTSQTLTYSLKYHKLALVSQCHLRPTYNSTSLYFCSRKMEAYFKMIQVLAQKAWVHSSLYCRAQKKFHCHVWSKFLYFKLCSFYLCRTLARSVRLRVSLQLLETLLIR